MKTPGHTVRRVLVVDDEPLVCDSIRRVLACDHYEVQTVATSHEALALCQRDTFDLVIADYEMPDMNGDKLAAAIKGLFPKLPIIMVTAFSESLRLAGSFPLPVDFVLSKPFGVEELRGAVRRLTA